MATANSFLNACNKVRQSGSPASESELSFSAAHLQVHLCGDYRFMISDINSAYADKISGERYIALSRGTQLSFTFRFTP